MKRRSVSASKDRKVFTRTASSTKKVNLPGTTYRGGLRF
nr:hypothetical protein RPNZKVPU_RPNZKVPU_CDS_0013 [Microvirus sp.]CAI9751583.1 hypothetical protein YKMJLDLN_YKMJLDLN_CDS_0010 [Microvirus sp.]CAI9752397.1 hypothetical protein AOJQRVMU_AOJQRVMU_CDS_0001 [Microvirus sp.]CAI9752412.1 hypothetical protein AOJQRVMU_AOJQRVMU_CDS_0016 [Microvirus sp.]